jgi:threonyl-tRNA synthetase
LDTLETMRHSAAHVMAASVCRLFPGVKLDIGPSTEEGFYYDFDLEHRLAPEDFPKIEADMKALIKAGIPFERLEVSREEAAKAFAGQTYKLERLADMRRSRFINAAPLWTSAADPTSQQPRISAQSN